MCLSFSSQSQEYSSTNPDSLISLLKITKNDTTRLSVLTQLSQVCELKDIPAYAIPAIELSDKLLKQKSFSHLKEFILSQKADALNNIGFYHMNNSDYSLAMAYYTQSLKLHEAAGYKTGISMLLNNIGTIYHNQGEISKALEYYEKSLKMKEVIDDQLGLAYSLLNLSTVYLSQGNIPVAIEYAGKSLKIQEQLGNKPSIAQALISLGAIYENQGDKEGAIDYYSRSLKIYEEIDDSLGKALTLNNLGAVYVSNKKFDLAWEHYRQSLAIVEKLNDKQSHARILNNIGSLNNIQGKWDVALEYFLKSLKGHEEISDKHAMAFTLLNIARVHQTKKNYAAAMLYADSSLAIAQRLGFPENIRNAELTLSELNYATGNHKDALGHYKNYIVYRDSINNETTRKASIKSQLKYEFDKKEAVIKEQRDKEKLLAEEQNRRQQIVICSVVAGLALVIIFSTFIFRTLKTTRLQKDIIEEKQKEIIDSIRYAERIQQSLMPPEKYLTNNIKRLKKH